MALPEWSEIIAAKDAEIERLNAVNALMEYAAFPSAEDARDAETWIAANPGRPLSDYCPPGGLLVKRLTAEVERLRAALEEVRDEYGYTFPTDTNQMIAAALKENRT
jgi:hypothetical protein